MGGGGPPEINIDNDSQMVTLDVIGKIAFAFDFEQCESTQAKTPPLRGLAITSPNSWTRTTAAVKLAGELFITPGPISKLQNFLGLGRVRT